MNALHRGKSAESSSSRAVPGYPIDHNSLSLLLGAISRWNQFLDDVFDVPVTGAVSEERLEQISLEDAEHYLDVKIQLSQCLRSVDNVPLERNFEQICGEIREASYHHISTTLPHLSDNRRSLLALANKDDHGFPDSAGPNMQWITPPELEVSQEYKECLILQRKELKSSILTQKRIAKSGVVRLIKTISERFRAEPPET